jgi:hypothetical protein
MGKLYSLGFDLESSGTFCSKFVHDDVYASTHQSVGEVETFDHLLHRNPRPALVLAGLVPRLRAVAADDHHAGQRAREPAADPVVQNNL